MAPIKFSKKGSIGKRLKYWPILDDFWPILAKETPQFFDRIKAGEFTLNNSSVLPGGHPFKWGARMTRQPQKRVTHAARPMIMASSM